EIRHEHVFALALDMLDDVKRIRRVECAGWPVDSEIDDLICCVQPLTRGLLAGPVHKDRIEIDAVNGHDLLKDYVGPEAVAAAGFEDVLLPGQHLGAEFVPREQDPEPARVSTEDVAAGWAHHHIAAGLANVNLDLVLALARPCSHVGP